LSPRPETPEEAAELLRSLGEEGRPVRPRGGGTKPWGPPGDGVVVETGGLARMLEHNVGDFTAVLEAGVPLADAQAQFAAEGQMLALDPPLSGPGEGAATVGGVMAANDSGPLRHRYGSVRDLVVGTTVALSDGTLARSGGKVIKNVAGYDLGKLFTGSLGTLGLIVRIAVRLHPLPTASASATGATDDPARLGAAAVALAGQPLEADCLDADWRDGAGRLLLRFGGAAAEHQAEVAAARLAAAGLEQIDTTADDAALWDAQRAHQRLGGSDLAIEHHCVVKVSGRMTDLPAAARAAQDAGGSLVGRAGLGLFWLTVPEGAVAGVRDALAPRACTLLDAPDALRADAWAAPDAGALAVMARVKERFDPARIFRPGTFVGGI
jgi:glycolate oxidase FAD binding subunit